MIDDWLGSTRIALMDAEQERGYLRLLLHSAKSEDLGLPADDGVLSKLAMMPTSWRKKGAAIKACFEERDGRLYNRKLVEVAGKHNGIKKERSQAAGRRWAHANGMQTTCKTDANGVQVAHDSECKTDAKRMQTACKTDAPLPLPFGESPENRGFSGEDVVVPPLPPQPPETAENQQLAADAFDRFWRAYPRKTPASKRFTAENMWGAMVLQGQITAANIGEVFDGLNRWKRSRDWADQRYISDPAKWLAERRWRDEPAEAGEEDF